MKTEIRITDPYVIQAVERERALRGDKSRTVTAGRLIVERLTDLDRHPVSAAQPAPQPEPSAA